MKGPQSLISLRLFLRSLINSFISTHYGKGHKRFDFEELAGTEFQGLLSSRQAVSTRNDTVVSGKDSQSTTEASASNGSNVNSTVEKSDRKKRGN